MVVKGCSWAWLLVAFTSSILLQGTFSQLDNELEVLSSFFNVCGGNMWKRNDGWLNNQGSRCTWLGVTCDVNGAIVGIQLPDNDLNCEIPNALFYIPTLQSLDVSQNKQVSVNFASIDNVMAVNLRQVLFAGTRTTSLVGLDSLFNVEAIGASGNSLTGPFPKQIMKLSALSYLDLSYNSFSGTIPEDIHLLNKLRVLILDHNQFFGTLTSNIGRLTSLVQLSLQFNQMSGNLPLELSQLRNLTLLSLNDQSLEKQGGFTGPMLEFSDAPFLINVDVSNNRLSGTVPVSLLGFDTAVSNRLVSIDLSGNQLSGVLPAAFSRFNGIRLFLSDNQISGIDLELCSNFEWFFGNVAEFGCNGILCPPGTFNIFGRQVSTHFPCIPCPTSIFHGATKCDEGSETNERSMRAKWNNAHLRAAWMN